MINIVTVHWHSTRWIEPQLRYLERNISAPFRVFASLNGITDRAVRERFHLAEDVAGTHAEKLNELARVVYGEADPDDTLLFLDGDAFPIRPLDRWIDEVMGAFPLAAVRRDENLGDCQPHPCFCLTTVGFWHAIGGDWREGVTWTNSIGETTTDVGGNLLHLLAGRGIDWLPLLRTNTSNPNPIWFGIYDHRVYHHGAGFRPRISRVGHHLERARAGDEVSSLRGSSLEGLAKRAVRDPSLIVRVRPRHVDTLRQAAAITKVKQERVRRDRQRRRQERLAERYEQRVFGRLLSDPAFYRQFDATPI